MSGNPEYAIFLLRVLLVGSLYLLLLWAVLVARRAVFAAAGSSKAPPRRIVVLAAPDAGPTVGTAIALQPRTTIGRAPDNVIVIGDPVVSAHHAAIALRGDGWWVEDLGSTNGTLINDRPLSGPATVASGDEIQVGPARFRVAA
jgi:pSer/pThr/pTyr-binding forkhead associated (FHA) protein